MIELNKEINIFKTLKKKKPEALPFDFRRTTERVLRRRRGEPLIFRVFNGFKLVLEKLNGRF